MVLIVLMNVLPDVHICPLRKKSAPVLPDRTVKCTYLATHLNIWGRYSKFLGREEKPYMGGLGILWGGGDLDNPLETMYYLTLISLWVAIYTFPIT